MPVEGCLTVVAGVSCEVVMVPKVADFFECVDARPRASLLRYMRELSSGRRDFPVTQFNHEGFHRIGNGSIVAVWALKSSQIRLYGCYTTVAGQSVFICTECDTKKKNRADPAILGRAAKGLGKFIQG